MNVQEFLGSNFAEKDVHVIEMKDGYPVHVGYFFWEGGQKKHELQLIRAMRLEIGLDPLEIRQMLFETKLVMVNIENEMISLAN